MAHAYEDDEIPLPLVRRVNRRPTPIEAEPDTNSVRLHADDLEARDRMSPAMAGGLMGIAAGPVAFAIVHFAERARIEPGLAHAAAGWGQPTEVAMAIAYVTAAALGALVGACFASVTRHLRRFVPLVIWALVFFASLTLLVLAMSGTASRIAGAMAPAILAASAAYAIVWSFELPLRKRATR